MARLLAPDRPDWRWARVAELSACSKTAALARLQDEDEQTRLAFEFRRALDRGMAYRYPVYEAAYTYFMDRQSERMILEGMIVGGSPTDKIAYELFCPEEVVDAFHDLFFAVRPGLDRAAYLVSILFGGMIHANAHPHDTRGIIHRLAYKLGGDVFLEMCKRGLSSESTLAQLRQLTMEVLMGQAAMVSFGAGVGREMPEWMSMLLNQKESGGGAGGDYEKAIDSFFDGLAISVADPTDERNLALPAREMRVTEYEVVNDG